MVALGRWGRSGCINVIGETATAFTAATLARDATKDISFSADRHGALTDGTTLWFVDGNTGLVDAYVAATQARDSAIGHQPWEYKVAGRGKRWGYPMVR